MAYDAKKRARARRLYEYDGQSLDTVAQKLGVTVRCLEKWKKAEGWERFKHSAEVQEKERVTVLAEAEKAGITIGRHLKELALIGYSDLADHMEVAPDGSARVLGFEEMNKRNPGSSRVVKKIKERKTVRKDPDNEAGTIEEITTEIELHAKEPVLKEISDILGVKRVDQDAEKTTSTILDLIRSCKPK